MIREFTIRKKIDLSFNQIVEGTLTGMLNNIRGDIESKLGEGAMDSIAMEDIDALELEIAKELVKILDNH